MNDFLELMAGENDDGRRLDRILRRVLPSAPLSLIHKLLRKNKVLVDNKAAVADTRVSAGSVIRVSADVDLRHFLTEKKVKDEVKGDIKDRKTFSVERMILWEGEGLLSLNKPAGLEVHGDNSLESLVSAYLENKITSSLSFKPGPLHRLDKPTSGVIVFSTNLDGARYFSALIRDGLVKKEYLAVIDGRLDSFSVWKESLIRDKKIRKSFVSEISEGLETLEASASKKSESQEAQTLIYPIAVSSYHSLIKAEILTGRTHQIRAHAAFHGHPLSGDKKYGGSLQSYGFLLHAYKLIFHLREGGERITVRAPLPKLFTKRIEELFGAEVDC